MTLIDWIRLVDLILLVLAIVAVWVLSRCCQVAVSLQILLVLAIVAVWVWVEKIHSQLKDRVQTLQTDALAVQRADWLREVPTIQCHNEIEVEVKVIHPIVRFLGYHDSSIRLRYPMSIQFGQQKLQGVADWVLFRGLPSETASPFLVIEAKAPSEALDAQVQGQARSYAFALKAPFYILTNGRQLKLYRLELGGDQCLLDCSVQQLANHWSELAQWLGSRASGNNEQRS